MFMGDITTCNAEELMAYHGGGLAREELNEQLMCVCYETRVSVCAETSVCRTLRQTSEHIRTTIYLDKICRSASRSIVDI